MLRDRTISGPDENTLVSHPTISPPLPRALLGSGLAPRVAQGLAQGPAQGWLVAPLARDLAQGLARGSARGLARGWLKPQSAQNFAMYELR